MIHNPKVQQAAAKALIWMSGLLTLAILLAIVAHIQFHGLPELSLEYLVTDPDISWGDPVGGIRSTMFASAYLVAISLLLAAPIGVGAAVFLCEYMRDGPFVRTVRLAIETLAGIPSIVFGLFGYSVFVIYLGMQWSMLAGGFTLACMVLPTIVRTSEEAIRSVPAAYREGSLALGATRWQTIRRVVIPSAFRGIATGLVLSIGRALGETAAVMLTAGMSLGIPILPTQPGRAMSVHLYILAQEHVAYEQAYAAASVLVLIVLSINILASVLRHRAHSV
jgi:phosphate transport system permease protein